MARVNERLNRRDVLKGFGLGALGLGLGGKLLSPAASFASPGSRWIKKNGLFRKAPGPAKVCLVKGNDCRGRRAVSRSSTSPSPT